MEKDWKKEQRQKDQIQLRKSQMLLLGKKLQDEDVLRELKEQCVCCGGKKELVLSSCDHLYQEGCLVRRIKDKAKCLSCKSEMKSNFRTYQSDPLTRTKKISKEERGS